MSGAYLQLKRPHPGVRAALEKGPEHAEFSVNPRVQQVQHARPTLFSIDTIPSHWHGHQSREICWKSLSYSRRRPRTHRRSVAGSTAVFEEEELSAPR
jgi:hypothetical protein